jgi:hypothetical protein
MRRKFHVRFGGGPGEKVEQSNLARGLPCDKATKLVLAGDVAVLDDGRAVVTSFTDPTKTYAVEHSVCTCQDFPRAPHGFCAHRLAVAMARRAREVMPSQPEASSPAEAGATAAAPVAPASLGEAPASVNCHIMLEGRQVQVTLRDTDEQCLLERLAAVLRQHPDLPPSVGKKGIKTSGETSETKGGASSTMSR